MNRPSFLMLIALAVFWFMSPLSVAASTCPTPKDILTDPATEVAETCDTILQIYKAGFESKIRASLTKADPPFELEYYAAVRTYLLLQNLSTSEKERLDAFGFLLSQTVTFDYADFAEEKKNLYQAYVLAQYLLKNKNLRHSHDHLFGSVGHLLRKTPVDTIKELNCVILFDYPEFSLEEILKSDSYTQCVAAELKD